MPDGLYIGSLGPQGGKSLVLLGTLELLSRRVGRLGLFRPVIRDSTLPDNDIELARQRFGIDLPYRSMYALTRDEVRQRVAGGRPDNLLQEVFDRVKALDEYCDFLVCEGTEYSTVASSLEFDFNARLANHLGFPVLIVASGMGATPDEIVGRLRAAREAFADEGCSIIASIVNRVAAQDLATVAARLAEVWTTDDPAFLIPESPDLARPTVGEVFRAIEGQVLQGDTESLSSPVLDYQVAAMHLPNFLDHVTEGGLVIVPGDRAEILLGCAAVELSAEFPSLAGVVLCGGTGPSAQIERLIRGLRNRGRVPVCSVASDTWDTVMRAGHVPASITPDNERKIASAIGLFNASVDLAGLEQRIDVTRTTRVTPMMFEYRLLERAEANRQHIVLPEGNDPRILQAADILLRRNTVDLTLLGDPQRISEDAEALRLDLAKATCIDPFTSGWLDDFAASYFALRRHKGIPEAAARDTMTDVSYFGTMMVYKGYADGMVSGAAHTTAHTIRPAFEFIRTVPGCSIVSSVFLMCLEDRVLVYGDCAVNPEPSPEQLADIAASSAATAAIFGIEPRIAMLSYSTGDSGHGREVDRVREATRLARERYPDLLIEGPLQYDAAVDPEVARKKLPHSAVAGRATVFVFPDLNTGNNTYKAVQRSSGAVAIGPVLQGLNKPVNDLSRGCTVRDIVNTVAITAIQAQLAGRSR